MEKDIEYKKLDKIIEHLEHNKAIITFFKKNYENDFLSYCKDKINTAVNQTLFTDAHHYILAYYYDNNKFKYFFNRIINVYLQKMNLSDTIFEDILQSRLFNIFSKEYNSIIENIVIQILNKTNILTLNNNNLTLKNPNDKLIINLYKEIKQYIRNNIQGLLPNITRSYYYVQDYYINNDIIEKLINIDWQTLQNIPLTKTDKEMLIQEAYSKYKPEFKEYIIKYTESHSSESNINTIIFPKLTKYINNNLKKIFLQFELKYDRNDPEMYNQSWFAADGSLNELYERKYLKNWLVINKNMILQNINVFKLKISKKDWKNIIDEYLNDYYPELEYKIHNLISYKNDSTRKTRSNNLITLLDEIGESININYDPTDDHIRSRPIIIIKDKNTKQDYVMFGPKGSSHGNYVENYLFNELANKNIDFDPTYMGYGYLLDKIAFVDKVGDNYQSGYTFEDEVNILKNDPRIVKVYQTASHPMPGGGLVKRLAKLIYTKFKY